MAKFFGKCNRYYRLGAPAIAKASGIYPYFNVIEGEQNPIVKMGGHDVIMLGSNNYLGMSSHPEVKQAAIDAINKYGVGTTGSRLLNGTMELHVELEQRLAEFMGTEDAIVFSTGMQTNLGGISSLLTEKDEWIISDEKNHASIIDGIRLGKNNPNNKLVYKHNDMEDLEKKLKQVPKGKALIVTDGVFSMEGDIAPLDHIKDLAEDRGAGVYVDDAHSIGVLGPHGRGTAAYFGIDVDVTMGTFSKSFASIGGFIATNKKITNWMRHKARSFIFSASPSPANVAVVLKILEIIEKNDSYQKNLLSVANRMRNGLKDLGFNVGNSTTPIIPIIIGKQNRTFKVYKKLFQNLPKGVYTNPVVAPATDKGRELLRTSYIATMNNEIIDEALGIFENIGRSMKII